jgi:hypothetical protein
LREDEDGISPAGASRANSCRRTVCGPDVTYFYQGEVSVGDVLTKARDAVAGAKRKGRFFVEQVQTWTSFNLLPVENGKGKC